MLIQLLIRIQSGVVKAPGCQKDGLEPFFLTVTLGTTTTCAENNFG